MKNSRNRTIVIAAELIIIGILFVCIGFNELKKDKKTRAYAGAETEAAADTVDIGDTKVPTSSNVKKDTPATPTPEPTPTLTPEEQAELERLAREEEERIAREKLEAEVDGILERTDLMAQMYDYDKAIETVKAVEGYESVERLSAAIASYEEQKSKLVKWPDNTQISHLFVHSLIVDTSLAFGKGSSQPVGYNRYMTTVDEFNKMLEQMYAKGYVIVSVHDMAERVVGEDGQEKLVMKDIWLPEGKIPFVLSQDDVNYYVYMQKNG
ncbi:MAG: hypothetical protein J6U61_01195, partial [Lachnospiraceae bacterium]|nr:hypothetical protein [Lachnospiraceae bacterium]